MAEVDALSRELSSQKRELDRVRSDLEREVDRRETQELLVEGLFEIRELAEKLATEVPRRPHTGYVAAIGLEARVSWISSSLLRTSRDKEYLSDVRGLVATVKKDAEVRIAVEEKSAIDAWFYRSRNIRYLREAEAWIQIAELFPKSPDRRWSNPEPLLAFGIFMSLIFGWSCLWTIKELLFNVEASIVMQHPLTMLLLVGGLGAVTVAFLALGINGIRMKIMFAREIDKVFPRMEELAKTTGEPIKRWTARADVEKCLCEKLNKVRNLIPGFDSDRSVLERTITEWQQSIDETSKRFGLEVTT